MVAKRFGWEMRCGVSRGDDKRRRGSWRAKLLPTLQRWAAGARAVEDSLPAAGKTRLETGWGWCISGCTRGRES